MEPEPKQTKMTANAEDASSPINSEEVPAAVTRKGGNSDQSGMYLNDIKVGSIFMAESVCNSIPLEKEIGSGTIKMLSYEDDESRDIDIRVEEVLANVSSEDVRCEATHTFQKLSTTDWIELDVVDVSSANIVHEEKFGEAVFPEKIRNNTDRSRMIDLALTISVLKKGSGKRPDQRKHAVKHLRHKWWIWLFGWRIHLEQMRLSKHGGRIQFIRESADQPRE